MSTSRDSLREKFRTICLDRLRVIRNILSGEPAPEQVREALSELHTIKGEAAIAGLTTLSQLAHALEDLVSLYRGRGRQAMGDVLAALDVIHDVLESPCPDLSNAQDLADLLAEVRAGIQQSAAPESLRVEPHSAPVPRALRAEDPSVERQPAPSPVRWMRIEASRIDALCERVTEVALSIGRLQFDLARTISRPVGQTAMRDLLPIRHQLESSQHDLDEIVSAVWGLRLVPLAPALADLMAYARSLAEENGKRVELEASAPGVELERAMLDDLHEPLMHLVRNAIDHGIEPPDQRGPKPPVGRVRCTAEAHGEAVLVVLEDDGAGLHRHAIRERAVGLGLVSADRARLLPPAEIDELIFLPGFTQRETANEVSGRGMGLWAARRKVEGLGGSLRVESTTGRGTRFELAIASKVSKERMLIVEAARARYGLPAPWVVTVVRDPRVLEKARQSRMHRENGRLLPVRSLSERLGCPGTEESALLVVEIGGQTSAILVERVVGERDLLRRPADRLLATMGSVTGSAALDDGTVVLLLRWAEVLRDSACRPRGHERRDTASTRTPRVLVVDDSPVVRDIVAEILIAAGLAVEVAPNGAAALERLPALEVDLVISDVEMPRMDGFELLERIRERTETLPVIMLTTRSSPEDRRRAASLGANAYVIKSEFQGGTLLNVVGRFVELSK